MPYMKAVSFKQSFLSMINSITVDLNGQSMIQQNQLIDIYNHFRLLTSESWTSQNRWSTIGFYPDVADAGGFATTTSIYAPAKAISCDLTAGTNISIDASAISCDLSAGTNISIDASTKAISCDLSAGTNISIDASAISCDLTAGTNISIDASTKAISCDLSAGTNISIDASTKAISCDLTAGENISIDTDGVISSTGGGTTIDTTADLNVNTITTQSTTRDNIMNGKLLTGNTKFFSNNQVKDLDGLTNFNLVVNNEYLSANYVSYFDGLYTFQNLTGATTIYLFIVTAVLSVESDVYEGRVNWRLSPH